jgi:hypothetical protein
MGLKINQLLMEIQAMPDMENWNDLNEKFREKYRELQAYMADHNNDTSQRTPEIAQMDDSLCQLLNDLHDIEEIEGEEPETLSDQDLSENEPVDDQEVNEIPETQESVNDEEIENTPDMKKQEQEQEQSPEINKSDGDNQVSNENMNTEVPAEQSPAFIEQQTTPPPTNNFEAWAITQETISAKDLRRFNIPEGLWKSNKIELTIGNVRLRKTVAGLIFNSWEVIKQ